MARNNRARIHFKAVVGIPHMLFYEPFSFFDHSKVLDPPFLTPSTCTKNKRLTYSPVFHNLVSSHGSPILCTFSSVCLWQRQRESERERERERYWDMFMHPTLFLPSFIHRHHIIPKVSVTVFPTPCHCHLTTLHLSSAALLFLYTLI
jgi:hypothetical protein